VILERTILERSLFEALNKTPNKIPVLMGKSGSGRTALLRRIAQQLGDTQCQYIDVERAASTPEEFYEAVKKNTPFLFKEPKSSNVGQNGARAAFENLLAFFDDARSQNGENPTFLIDEFLEIRTFESFPGLRNAVQELLKKLTQSNNKFILTTRFTTRIHRLLCDAQKRFELINVQPFSTKEVFALLRSSDINHDRTECEEISRIVHALTEGRPLYAKILVQTLSSMNGASSGDPVSALASELNPGAYLYLVCLHFYELRLHHARGYGALKGILQILAIEDTLTLTEISQRLRRTPGSTKDYLSWLEDVDLIKVEHKRYSFSDPILKLWVRLYCRPTPPTEFEISKEVQEYAVIRLPLIESEFVDTKIFSEREGESSHKTKEPLNIIEID